MPRAKTDRSLVEVVVYVKRGCPYCTGAVELLQDKGVRFEVIHVEGRADLRRWLSEATGRHTVPQIFIDGEPVGGFDDLAKLDREGELDELLVASPSVDNPSLPS